MKTQFHIFILFFTYIGTSFTQVCFDPITFTWEGSFSGNQAVWNIDDVSNIYPGLKGIDVQVKLIDPFSVNTSTSNPSDYSDYTKTNTFFGRGNLAFQLTSSAKNQSACLEFSFTKPILLSKFEVFDIDYIASSPFPLNTYRDSLSFFAVNDSGAVNLQLEPLKANHQFDIFGQSVRAFYEVGLNGDLTHRDSTGAIRISSQLPVQKFTLCYANADIDGFSNSHAVKLQAFSFCEAFGSLAGTVLEHGTNTPLAGSVIRLYDEFGLPVTDTHGNPLEIITGNNGQYFFDKLPFGIYEVRQTDPIGYESYNDIDGVNDNKIRVNITVKEPYQINKDFYEQLFAPLPVRFGDFKVSAQGEGFGLAEWFTFSETNNDYFQVWISDNGISYTEIGKVYSSGNSNSPQSYQLKLTDLTAGLKYIQLTQTDLDGRTTGLGIRTLNSVQSTKFNFKISPNPSEDNIFITTDNVITTLSEYQILHSNGNIIQNGNLDFSTGSEVQLNIRDLLPGTYIIQIRTNSETVAKKFIRIR
ncbi:MAG: T9SS type A sorting domain-containing protein [Saprospiraceae bacterium]|nr:T9SS type A sorting domain-containing protein [Saprospiraceae bacterium]